MTAGIKANLDGSAAVQVGNTDFITTTSGGAVTIPGSLTVTGAVTLSTTLSVAQGGTGQTSYTNGQLLIGNTTGNTLAKATLTQGNGMSITNGAGSITVDMGTPSTLTNTTTNSASGTTHTHALTGELVETTTGNPLYYGARAWVNFNGTGTVAIRQSANVSSITDNNTGDYTINFSTAMPDANYVMHGSGSNSGTVSTPIVIMRWNTTAPTTSAGRIGTTNDAGSAVDNLYALISVFR